MSPSSNEFEPYLAAGEAVVAGTAGTLFDDSYRSAGAIAVTDRRVLFVAEEDGFVDVAHESISSIRGRPRRGFTYREMGPALLAVLGASIAVTAFVGVLVVEPGVLAFLLLLVAVGGVALAEHVRRRGVEDGWRALVDVRAALTGSRPAAEPPRGWVSTLRNRLSSNRRALDGARGDPDLLVVGLVSVALIATVGLIAVTGSLLVVPLVLSTLGGVALAEFGYRRHRKRDAGREDRPLGRDVSIHLVDGRVVHLRVDPDVRFDRDLSAAVRESAPRTVTAELTEP